MDIEELIDLVLTGQHPKLRERSLGTHAPSSTQFQTGMLGVRYDSSVDACRLCQVRPVCVEFLIL